MLMIGAQEMPLAPYLDARHRVIVADDPLNIKLKILGLIPLIPSFTFGDELNYKD